MKCNFEPGSEVCKAHNSPKCPVRAFGELLPHCTASHGNVVEPSPDPNADLELPTFEVAPGLRFVDSSALRKRIVSEGRWGFFAGLMTGLLIAGLVFFLGPP